MRKCNTIWPNRPWRSPWQRVRHRRWPLLTVVFSFIHGRLEAARFSAASSHCPAILPAPGGVFGAEMESSQTPLLRCVIYFICVVGRSARHAQRRASRSASREGQGDGAPYSPWLQLAHSHFRTSCCFPRPFLFQRTPIGPVLDITLESSALLAATPPL